MAQQDKQMRVGACEGLAYHLGKLVSLANGSRYEVDFNTFFQAVKPPIHLKYCSVPTLIYIYIFFF